MVTFGEKLRNLRLEKGLTLFALSTASGLRESTIYNIEKGNRPASEDNMRKLASVPALDITYEKLRVWQVLEKASKEDLEYLISELEKMKDQKEKS